MTLRDLPPALLFCAFTATLYLVPWLAMGR